MPTFWLKFFNIRIWFKWRKKSFSSFLASVKRSRFLQIPFNCIFIQKKTLLFFQLTKEIHFDVLDVCRNVDALRAENFHAMQVTILHNSTDQFQFRFMSWQNKKRLCLSKLGWKKGIIFSRLSFRMKSN